MKMTGRPAHRIWLASLLVVTSIVGGLWPSLLFGQLRATLRACDEEDVGSMVFSPDGKTLATRGGMMSSKQQLKLWDTRTGKLRWTQDAPTHGSSLGGMCEIPLAFSPNSKTIAYSAVSPDLLILREVGTGTIKWITQEGSFETLLAKLPCLTFLPDGKSLAWTGRSEAFDGVVTLLSTETGQEQGKLIDANHHFRLLTFSPDGKTMATANTDPIRRHPDGGAGVSTGRDKATITLWDVATRKQRAVLTCPGKGISSLAFSPDGEMLVSNEGVAVTVWDTEKGKVKWRFRPGGGPRWRIGRSMAFNARGDTLVLCTQAPFGIVLFDLKTGKPKWTLRTPIRTERRGSNPLTNFMVTGVSPSGRMAGSATYSPGAAVRLRDTHSPGDSLAASANPTGGEIRLWDTHTGRELASLPGSSVELVFVAFSPDDKYLAGAHRDGAVSLWNIEKFAPKTPSASQPTATPKRGTREEPKAEFRTWTSADGRFTVEARFVQVTAEMVTLKRKDGRTIQVPIAKLGSKDQDFIGMGGRRQGAKEDEGTGDGDRLHPAPGGVF